MRLYLIAALSVSLFTAVAAIETIDATAAVVCARGVAKAGCVTATGAAVVRGPAAACRYVVVNGVRLRRCI